MLVMSRRVSSAPMGERHQRSVSGEVETDNVVSRSDEAVLMLLVSLRPRPQRRGLGRVGGVLRPLVGGLG
jgi:hypothetical protein